MRVSRGSTSNAIVYKARRPPKKTESTVSVGKLAVHVPRALLPLTAVSTYLSERLSNPQGVLCYLQALKKS